MASKNKRLFLSIPLPSEQAQAIKSCIPKYKNAFSQNKASIKKLRWMPRENWHITLYFIGKTGSAALPLLQRKLTALFTGQITFKLRFKSICYAPPKGKKRMIWAKFDTPSEFAQLVYAIYEELVEDFGVQPPHKKIIPHATLARFKKIPRSYLPDLIQPSITQKIKVQHCELWESQLSSKGPTYHSLARFPFNE